jgi:hypothetical protein
MRLLFILFNNVHNLQFFLHFTIIKVLVSLLMFVDAYFDMMILFSKKTKWDRIPIF